jgi:hypothetical protein
MDDFYFTININTLTTKMPLHIYAEHLINIRTLTIQSTLPSPSNRTTACKLSADGDALTLTHQGETASIALPVTVPAHTSAGISIPAVPTKELSFRVRIGYSDTLQDRQSSETVIPWTAVSLSHNVELCCKNCRAVILPQGKIQTWKDLPSEGWAEMMEFWHCHKPNEPHTHEQQTDKKGYSADSKLAITPSVGLVNATSFILAAADCNNIKVGEFLSLHFGHLGIIRALKRTGASRPQGYFTWKIRDIAAQKQTFYSQRGTCCNPCASYGFSGEAMLLTSCDLIVPSRSSWACRTSAHRYILKYSTKYTIISFHSASFRMRANVSPAQMPEDVEDSNANTDIECSSCNATIGIQDITTQSFKLAKLALDVTSNTGNQQSFEIAKWLSCHLLSSMDNEGLRKFTVLSASGSQEPISIWIFAPDLNIASSASRQSTPLRVAKIMWKPAPAHVQIARLDTQSMTEGEIEMPAFESAALKRSLEESATLLPEGARRFLDWNVALLERFTVEDALLR